MQTAERTGTHSPPEPARLTREEFARRWRVSLRTPFNWQRKGLVTVERIGRTVRFIDRPPEGTAPSQPDLIELR